MALKARMPEDRLSRRRQRPRRLRSLSFLPTLVTLGNLTCGFAAIHFAMRSMYDFGAGVTTAPTANLSVHMFERMLPSFLSVGAGLVILGMVFDVFDGLVARVTRSTTNFGGQLDSLADVVSFGVAPATLMIALMTAALAGDSIVPSPISAHPIGRLAWVAGAFYVAFAAVRLARFNVEHADADADYKTFRGLPSPAAAAVMVAVILVQDQPYASSIQRQLVYAMPGVALVLGVLMVSRIPYRRFSRSFLLGRRPFGQFVAIMLLIVVFWSYKAATLSLGVLCYAMSGPVALLIHRARGRGANATEAPHDQEARKQA